MTPNMKGMLLSIGMLMGITSSRLVIYGPQNLKEKFASNGNINTLIIYPNRL
jgi:hypothetical protein